MSISRWYLEGSRCLFMTKFNLANIIRAPIQFGRRSSSKLFNPSFSKLTRFPIESARYFTLLCDKSSSFKYVNFPKVSRRVEMFVHNKFNFDNIIRALIEFGRRSSSQFFNPSFSNLTRFLLESGRYFTLRCDKSSSFKRVNFSMVFGRVEMFVHNKFNLDNILRAPIEFGGSSSSQLFIPSFSKLTRFSIESGRYLN